MRLAFVLLALMASLTLATTGGAARPAKSGGFNYSIELQSLNGGVATFAVARVKANPNGSYPVRLMASCGQGVQPPIYGDLKTVSREPVQMSLTYPTGPGIFSCLAWVYTETVSGQNPFYPESPFVAFAVD